MHDDEVPEDPGGSPTDRVLFYADQFGKRSTIESQLDTPSDPTSNPSTRFVFYTIMAHARGYVSAPVPKIPAPAYLISEINICCRKHMWFGIHPY